LLGARGVSHSLRGDAQGCRSQVRVGLVILVISAKAARPEAGRALQTESGRRADSPRTETDYHPATATGRQPRPACTDHHTTTTAG